MAREDSPQEPHAVPPWVADRSTTGLIESFPEICYLFDLDGRMLRWNRRTEERSGYGAEDIEAMHPVDFFPASDQERIREAIGRAFSAGQAQAEAHLLTHDGRLLPHLFTASRVDAETRPLVIGFGVDISERKQAEDALRHSEVHYRALVEQSITGVYVITDGIFSYVNQRFTEVFGYAEDEIVGRLRPQDLIAPEDRERVREYVRRRTSGEMESAHYVARGLRRDGRPLWLEIHGTRIEFDSGPTIAGTLLDITQRKQAEDALRESQRFLETLVGNLPGVVYRCAHDPQWTLYFVSQACHEVLGYSAEEMLRPGPPTLGELVHPDDHEHVWEAVSAAAARDEAFRVRYRITRPDGDVRWVSEQGRPVIGDEGEATAIEGFITDVTEHKEAEDEVRRLADRLTRTLESITDAFYTLDEGWRFSYVNQEAERVLGRGRDELLGQVIWTCFPELLGTSLEREFRNAMAEGRTTVFECYWPREQSWQEYNVYCSPEGLTVYFRDITQGKRDREQIEFLALYDPLTRLPNRRLLMDRLTQVLAGIERSADGGAVLFLDLDDFKSINDAFGHARGDQLLQQVAERLQSTVRREDTVARFGGDEFVVVLVNLSSDAERLRHRAHQIAGKLQAALTQPFRLDHAIHHASASIGIAEFSDASGSAEELLKRADLAMYRAKDGGANNVRLFEPSMETAVTSRVHMEIELHDGLQQEAIQAWYQPQVSADGRIKGVEALARWHHPDRGMISPAAFIPVAEQSGMIARLDRAILQQACSQLARWSREPALANLSVAVNINARHFHQPDFVAETLQLIEQTGIEPSRLHIELTESVLMEDLGAATANMRALRPHGVRISLDDFGTGYSSLSYLKNLPLDWLKIDQAFVRNMATDPNDAAIVRAVIAVADSLGLGVIAEGVETDEVCQLLASYGCSHYQGYLFARPLAPADFEAFALARA